MLTKITAQKAVLTFAAVMMLSSPVLAATYQKIGHGPCRAAGNVTGQVKFFKNVSLGSCMTKCSTKSSCRGIEYNIKLSRTECELHSYPVKLKNLAAGRNDIHSCWVKQ